MQGYWESEITGYDHRGEMGHMLWEIRDRELCANEQPVQSAENAVSLAGKRFFAMGGASSHDIQDGILEPDDPHFRRKQRALDARGAMYRVNRLSWWKEELPGEDEYQTARVNLEKAGWEVDYIITHCCPTSVQDEMNGGFYQADALTDFLDEVAQQCSFKYWFFGHYHDNKIVQKKYVLLYEQILRLKV